jgi:predicted ester cyclase
MAVQPPATATNGELVRRAFATLNEHEVEPLLGFWGPQTVERFPDATCVGERAIADYFLAIFAALPDFHIEILALAEQGDDVFVHWKLTGTHRGTFAGIAPTATAIALDGIDHFVVRDGIVVSNFVVFDQMQFARTIGLLPPDGSRQDRAMKAAFNAKTRLAERVRSRRRR